MTDQQFMVKFFAFNVSMRAFPIMLSRRKWLSRGSWVNMHLKGTNLGLKNDYGCTIDWHCVLICTHRQLSMLARGHGLLGGGVQVACFADDRRAFTLTVSSQVINYYIKLERLKYKLIKAMSCYNNYY